MKYSSDGIVNTSVVLLRKVPIDESLGVNDGEIQCPQLARDAAAWSQQILEHETKRYPVLGKFFLADIAYPIFLSGFFKY